MSNSFLVDLSLAHFYTPVSRYCHLSESKWYCFICRLFEIELVEVSDVRRNPLCKLCQHCVDKYCKPYDSHQPWNPNKNQS